MKDGDSESGSFNPPLSTRAFQTPPCLPRQPDGRLFGRCSVRVYFFMIKRPGYRFCFFRFYLDSRHRAVSQPDDERLQHEKNHLDFIFGRCAFNDFRLSRHGPKSEQQFFSAKTNPRVFIWFWTAVAAFPAWWCRWGQSGTGRKPGWAGRSS